MDLYYKLPPELKLIVEEFVLKLDAIEHQCKLVETLFFIRERFLEHGGVLDRTDLGISNPKGVPYCLVKRKQKKLLYPQKKRIKLFIDIHETKRLDYLIGWYLPDE